MLSNALKLSSPRTIKHLGYEHEITFSSILILYFTGNEKEAENVCHRKEFVKHEKLILSQYLTNMKIKNRGSRI